ncbi:DUF6878 family protein [Paraburkholderia sp.]|uniref:DUF6878 family protein n=1 Tax=Paraburkholderia sp. TaxID=1926495 RepID=UPI0039E46E84
MDLNPHLAHLSTVLRAAGAVSATAAYAGYGDSGDHFEITIQWPASPQESMDATTGLNPTTSDCLGDPDFDPRFESLVWNAVSATGHDGWENNEGGGGTFTLLPDGTATLEHYDNIEDSNESTHEFGPDSELATSLDAVGTVLRSVGARSVTVEYAGYGDSGHVETITLQWPGVPGMPPASIAIPCAGTRPAASATSGGELTTDIEERPFDDAIEDLLYDAIELAGHSGWENNEGGSGTFIVYADACACLVHCDNFTRTIDSSYTFGSCAHPASDGGTS